MNTQIGPPPATALQLLLAAERLFAEHGLTGVSLRQISLEAGSSNNSAIRYHFGSKEDLLRAIFAYRLGDLTQRRALLSARANPDDLRSQLEAHILPLIELAESPDSSYVSFIEQLQRAGAVDVFVHQPDALKSQENFITQMQRLLPHIPEPGRSMRIQQAQDLAVHLAAERERAIRRNDAAVPFALYVSGVVDGLAGFLEAPASAETEQLIARGISSSRR
ncbi:TetR/AcrR family transcriptional regulator [Mycobacterium sp. ITM-2016-00318]|uniref:TetR/AcrR family transcriptional regulator n=1 Tax=Mycobacterium sp. ITM-2016-00318 TaxID=2099693 RepID=UPI00287F5E8E|nr:TetR/AcrR family transcriptional regulator [Mycobacterium sp. ITM-2016-00318]WNG94513.1 TetR/AcrR family transcriptional regulator [Mycobacterium sp. ITM-2016-00318]